MKILVCGSRNGNPDVWGALDRLHADQPFTMVITGGAPGVDTIANIWARGNRVPSSVFMAAWKELGPRAGPIRNQRMLDEGKPDLVLAFPGGKGTADMVRRAERAGVRVVRVAQ